MNLYLQIAEIGMAVSQLFHFLKRHFRKFCNRLVGKRRLVPKFTQLAVEVLKQVASRRREFGDRTRTKNPKNEANNKIEG